MLQYISRRAMVPCRKQKIGKKCHSSEIKSQNSEIMWEKEQWGITYVVAWLEIYFLKCKQHNKYITISFSLYYMAEEFSNYLI